MEVCSGRLRKGFIWTIWSGMWRSSPDDAVKVLLKRCGDAFGHLLRTSSQRCYLDDPGWHGEVCSRRFRIGFKIVQINSFTKSPGATLHMPPRIVQINPLRNRLEQTSTCYTASSRYNLYEIVRSKPPHADSDRQEKTFTKSSGTNLHMLPRIVQIKP